MIKIYNTLTRKEVFQPLEQGRVKMYVCGPTVYNYIHVGNGRSVVSFDTIRRYLEYRGYEVDYVMNFTDVDDKIIRTAKELKTSAPEIADRFIEAFNKRYCGFKCSTSYIKSASNGSHRRHYCVYSSISR